MVYINILTYLDHQLFEQQFDHQKFSENYCFYENSTLDIEWDLVVVFESINKPITIRHKKGGLIFIAGEPPLGNVYTRKFLKQFDFIFTAHKKNQNFKNIIREQFFNDWHFGFDHSKRSHKYSFGELQLLKKPTKTKNISIITSSLAVLPIHIKRLDFISALKNSFGDEIDYFGRGFNFIEDKADAIIPYRFHICIENNRTNDLWTEKFADPLLGYSIPIYIGCPNINKYFPEDSFISLDINDINESISVIKEIISDPEKHYNQKIDKLLLARDLLINKYNIYPTLIKLYDEQSSNFGEIISSKINSNLDSLDYKFKNLKLRLIRFTYKKCSMLLKIFK
jgi:hypothetical protein